MYAFFFFHWILRSQIDSTLAKCNYPMLVFCSMFCLLSAIVKVEFSISSRVFSVEFISGVLEYFRSINSLIFMQSLRSGGTVLLLF